MIPASVIVNADSLIVVRITLLNRRSIIPIQRTGDDQLSASTSHACLDLAVVLRIAHANYSVFPGLFQVFVVVALVQSTVLPKNAGEILKTLGARQMVGR